MNENYLLEDLNYDDESFSFDDLETTLDLQLQEQLSDLSDMNIEFEKIENPDSLRDTVTTVIWEQFVNQIGINKGLGAKTKIDERDFDQETMDKARNSSGDFVDKFVIDRKVKKNETNYSDDNIEMRKDPKFTNFKGKINQERYENGNKIYDEYTGNQITGREVHNVDHVVPGRRIHKDRARKFAGIKTKDLANQEENYAVTNEFLNNYKRAKTNSETLENFEIKKEGWKRERDATILSVNSSNKYDLDKRKEIEIAEMKYKGKSGADSQKMLDKERAAENKINQDIKDGIKASVEGKILKAKEQGKEIASSSLKSVLMGLLASLMKKIIQKLIQWLISAKKSFSTFLDSLKESIKEFFSNLKQHLYNAGDSLLTTIATALFGPIINMVKKAWIFLKQGYKSIKEAVAYIKSPENKGKPLSILMLQVGKIVTAGLTAGGALILGQTIENSLITLFPGFGTPIPLLGSLASILGIFFGALTSGIIGAIALNLIDKMIAKKQRSILTSSQIDKGNEILATQNQLIFVAGNNVADKKNNVLSDIHNRHSNLRNKMNNTFIDNKSDNSKRTENDDNLDDLFALLNS
ncbi:AI-2E family transporter [Bergeyella sp. RCAD1439]|uniref:AI-2E family transporter n=1 Tax=Bergeyella anatis TaxID=3113737 RepID=UPI002E195623|nr:hypothetical protein [Bergeyella sp. RCAD1439]